MAKKYYAVKKGHTTGIFETWEECKKQVDGFSGASYKGFPNIQQAQEFLGIEETTDEKMTDLPSVSDAVAYVDGSYNDATKEFSYGMIIFHDDIEERFAEKFNNPDIADMRNVAGEIIGAEKAMQFCIDNRIKSLDLYYDYEGIEKWCTEEWKAKKIGTKAYKEYYDGIKYKLNVNFYKVAGHSGDKYNELADELAKSALGISKIPDISHSMNSMTANNIKYDDVCAIIEMLKEDIDGIIAETCSTPYGKGFNLSVKRPHKQKLKVIHFSDKNKLWVQGKKEELFNQLSMYIVELLETEEVPEFLNTVHNLTIEKEVIESEFDVYFPNAKGKLPEKVNNYLHQAIYNLKIVGDVYNATFLVEPAIRPLEAVLKIALQENDIPIREDSKHYDTFFVFSKKKGKYALKQEFIKPKHEQPVIDYLGMCYSHFNENRHTLSHWDNPLEPIDTTRIIKTTEEAHALIKDTISIIDNYYSL